VLFTGKHTGQTVPFPHDIGETQDVAAEHPEVVARLTQWLADARFDSPDFPLQRDRKK